MRKKITPCKPAPASPQEGRVRQNGFDAFCVACDMQGQQGPAGAENIINKCCAFRTVVSQIEDCIFIVDPESKGILFANPALARLLGGYPGSLYDFIGHDRESVNRSIGKIKAGKAFRGERIFRKTDGGIASLEVSARRIPFGDECAICMVARDISGRIEEEEGRRNAERLAAMSSVAKGIAHDSTNAIWILQSTIARMMLESSEFMLPESLKHFSGQLADIETATNQLASMVEELKEITRASSAKREPAWISSIVKSQVFSAAQYGVGISFEIPKDTWAVEVNCSQIGRVIENIFRNASQAIAENDVKAGSILVRASNETIDKPIAGSALKSGNYVLVSIADNGGGIAEKDLPRIFDMHYSTRKDRGGSGIGLAVCRLIVEEHGGRIAVESDFGRGAVFHLYLPASDKKPPEVERITGEYHAAGHGT